MIRSNDSIVFDVIVRLFAAICICSNIAVQRNAVMEAPPLQYGQERIMSKILPERVRVHADNDASVQSEWKNQCEDVPEHEQESSIHMSWSVLD